MDRRRDLPEERDDDEEEEEDDDDQTAEYQVPRSTPVEVSLWWIPQKFIFKLLITFICVKSELCSQELKMF